MELVPSVGGVVGYELRKIKREPNRIGPHGSKQNLEFYSEMDC